MEKTGIMKSFRDGRLIVLGEEIADDAGVIFDAIHLVYGHIGAISYTVTVNKTDGAEDESLRFFIDGKKWAAIYINKMEIMEEVTTDRFKFYSALREWAQATIVCANKEREAPQ